MNLWTQGYLPGVCFYNVEVWRADQFNQPYDEFVRLGSSSTIVRFSPLRILDDKRVVLVALWTRVPAELVHQWRAEGALTVFDPMVKTPRAELHILV